MFTIRQEPTTHMAQAYGQVRAIFSYHAESLRWGDIGYNFLIDRYGTIYEGRRGSLDSLPLGAQAGGFNTNTFGISTIGNFDVAQPPAGMVESLKRYFAWKGLQYGINATGTTTLTLGRGTSKHSRVPDHDHDSWTRDTHATACPGRSPVFPTTRIRKDVATPSFNQRPCECSELRHHHRRTDTKPQDNTVLRAEPTNRSTIVERLPRTQVTHLKPRPRRMVEVTINGTTGWIAHRHFTQARDHHCRTGLPSLRQHRAPSRTHQQKHHRRS